MFWVIKDFNGTIKMIASKHISNASIIIIKYIILRDDILTVWNNMFLNLDIKVDSRIVIDWYNKKNNISNFIMLLINNIWKLMI